MATTRKNTQADQPPKRELKSVRQRKEDFEEKQREAGRRAVIVHLSKEARNNLYALRRVGRLTKTGSTTSADVLEGLLTSATTMATIEDAQEAIALAKPRTRGAAAARAQALFNKFDELLSTADIEDGVLSQHGLSRYRWASDLARDVMDRVRAGANAEDLRWFFYERLDDYVMHLFDNMDFDAEPSSEERDTLGWVRAQLGLPRD